MRADALFVAAYATALLALSASLHRLGRVRTDPWGSRVLAGHRRDTEDGRVGDRAVDWPHSEVPRLHTGMALVAAAAATLLAAAEVLRRHHLAETVVLGSVLIVGGFAFIRMVRQQRGRA